MGKLSIEEQNEKIIRSRFPLDRRAGKSDNRIGSGVNEELVVSIKEHRKEFGLSTKFQLLRNFLRTKPFIRTTICNAA